MLTEQDAREKYCCTGGRPSGPFCIGSHCMAWKWEHKLFQKDESATSWMDPNSYEWRKTGKGYCGLVKE